MFTFYCCSCKHIPISVPVFWCFRCFMKHKTSMWLLLISVHGLTQTFKIKKYPLNAVKQLVDYRPDSNVNSIHWSPAASNHHIVLSGESEQCVLDVSHWLQTSLMMTLDTLHWEVRSQRSTLPTVERMCVYMHVCMCGWCAIIKKNGSHSFGQDAETQCDVTVCVNGCCCWCRWRAL